MRTSPLLRALLVPSLVLAAAAACGRADARETTVTDDLRRDLDLAAAAGVELAPAGGGARIVSAVERVPQRALSTASRVATRRPQRAPEPAPEPEADVVAEVAEQPAEVVGTSAAPSIDLVEASMPDVRVASTGRVGEGDRGAGGGIIGAIGGVVIRGGGVGMGDDDCEIHPGARRGRGIPPGGVLGPVVGNSGILVNRRIPGAGRPIF